MEQTFDRLSALDSFFVDTEREDMPMHIGAVCLFEDPQPGDRRVTLRRLRAHVEARLSMIPRYRQRLMRVPLEGHPVWVDCADFRISDHVRGVALPAPSSPGHLEETVSWIMSQPLARSRPLWEIWLIEGLPSGGFALACKTHHCLADGLSGAALLCAVLGSEPFSIPETPRAWRPRPLPSQLELLRDAIDTRLRGAASLASDAASNAMFSPRNMLAGAGGLLSAMRSLADASLNPPVATAFDRPTGSDRRFLWWSVALDDVKRIGRRLGGTVNDVALTLVSEAFSQTCTNSDGRDLRVYCPVGDATDVSTLRLGNKVSGMLLDLPLDSPDLKTRWQRVRAAAREAKENGSVQGAILLENVANSLSPSLLARLEQLTGSTKTFNLILTNVPGPQVPLYLFEQKMTGVCPLVPLFRGQGLGIAIFSYAGLLTWGFHVDASCIDAARKLRSSLATAVIKMARLADQTVSSTTQEKTQPIPIHTPRVERDRIARVAG
ncbi:MAG TPA: wax ester/triacylglycerol synthase family O-acyltransferase [Candidatus Limnocylindrales bacterium]|nr:wax ester/triacylglycerol synthase family O-acyltransferase [Candidatus Limnocylindrales bacterium]